MSFIREHSGPSCCDRLLPASIASVNQKLLYLKVFPASRPGRGLAYLTTPRETALDLFLGKLQTPKFKLQRNFKFQASKGYEVLIVTICALVITSPDAANRNALITTNFEVWIFSEV